MTLTISKTLKFAAIATAVAIGSAAVPGVSAPAEAKKVIFVKKVFHKHFAHRHHRYIGTGLLLAGGGYYAYNNGCYWLKVRAINTGSEYWWDRYHACRGE